MNVDDVTCRELVERITDLLDGRLTAEEQTAVDRHLAECPGCAAAIGQFERTVGVLGRLGDDDIRQLDPEVVARLLDALRRRD